MGEPGAANFSPPVSITRSSRSDNFCRQSVKEVIVTIFVAGFCALVVRSVCLLSMFLQRCGCLDSCQRLVLSRYRSAYGTSLFISRTRSDIAEQSFAVRTGARRGSSWMTRSSVGENVERQPRARMTPKEAAHVNMDEVVGALIAISLTLCAVFVSVRFLSCISAVFRSFRGHDRGLDRDLLLCVSLTLSPPASVRSCSRRIADP